MTARRETLQLGNGLRAIPYFNPPRDLIERSATWLAERAVPEGQEMRGGRSWRVGGHFVKLFEPEGAPRRYLRPSAAVRSADLHARLVTLRVPAPVLAISSPGRGSLLITEFVPGRNLTEAFADEPAAIEAFPAFMARMHRRAVYHGDLHPWNVLWNGEAWYLVDLAGLRHRLHALRRGRLIEAQWARIYVCMHGLPELEGLHGRYWKEVDPGADVDRRWRSIVRLAERDVAARGGFPSWEVRTRPEDGVGTADGPRA